MKHCKQDEELANTGPRPFPTKAPNPETLEAIREGDAFLATGKSELSSNRALAILSGALSIIAGMFVFIYPLWSAKMLVIFSGAALLVFGVTLIVRAIQFGKLVH